MAGPRRGSVLPPALLHLSVLALRVRGPEGQEHGALRAGLESPPGGARDAERVPAAQVEDLVVDLHAHAAVDHDVHLLLLAVAVAEGQAEAGRDPVQAQPGALELERDPGEVRLQAR